MNTLTLASRAHAVDPVSKTAGLKAELVRLVGPDRVHDDFDARRLHSQDIWSEAPHTVALIVAPRGLIELRAVVQAITAAGYAIAPRGGGMSYTSGYVPQSDQTVSLDLSAMNRVLEIRPDDMIVSVEAGCTWAALDAALKIHGLRTPFWGPMSGLTSTIGGGLSQLNAMFGAGHYGTSSESVVGLTVVLADGQLLRTGARAADDQSPFYRHYGPDLAGLFCGDAGVFGVKAEITLRLIRRPAHEAYASFSFDTGVALLSAMAEMARAGIASEMCAFDPGLARVRMKRASLASDVKVLGSVIAKNKSLAGGLLSAAKIAMAGRNIVDEGDYSLHVICEGRSDAGVKSDAASALEIAVKAGGRAIENTIAKIIRAQPFPPLNSILGPEGERWAPVHGIASLSKAPTVFAEIEALFAEMKPEFDREGVYVGYLFTSVSTNALIIEPVFYWPEARHAVIETAIEAQHLARLPVLVANPQATRVVAEARRRVIEICARLGCAHFQVGRSYPYLASRDASSRALLCALKTVVDPTGALNPNGLGLDARRESMEPSAPETL